MNQDEIKNNLLNPRQWIRILYMAGYALAAWAVMIVLLLTLLIQLIMVLINGKANFNLQKTSFSWGRYLQQIVYFITYVSDEKPFPFQDFPGSDGIHEIMPDEPQASGKTAPPADDDEAYAAADDVPAPGEEYTVTTPAAESAGAPEPGDAGFSNDLNDGSQTDSERRDEDQPPR